MQIASNFMLRLFTICPLMSDQATTAGGEKMWQVGFV